MCTGHATTIPTPDPPFARTRRSQSNARFVDHGPRDVTTSEPVT